jgi:hypothetical protein
LYVVAASLAVIWTVLACATASRAGRHLVVAIGYALPALTLRRTPAANVRRTFGR